MIQENPPFPLVLDTFELRIHEKRAPAGVASIEINVGSQLLNVLIVNFAVELAT